MAAAKAGRLLDSLSDSAAPHAPSLMETFSPAVRWGGAFWYWAKYGGDQREIVKLLRAGVALPPERAALLADILDGSVRPARSSGGPSARAQERKERRNEKLRIAFQIALQDLKATDKYPRGRGAQLKQDALGQVAEWSSLSVDVVRKIVEAKPSPTPWLSFNELITRKKPP